MSSSAGQPALSGGSVPSVLLTHARTSEFWSSFFYWDSAGLPEDAEDRFAELDGADVVIAVGGGHGLVLKLQPSMPCYTLALLDPDGGPRLELGFDDDANFEPNVLRWQELDLICRAAAVLDPRVPYPGLALALLCRFVILSGSEELDAVLPLVRAALAAVRSADVDDGRYWPQVRDWLEGVDYRSTGVPWRRTVAGAWAIDDELIRRTALHTSRLANDRGPTGDWPFERWQETLTVARRTLDNARSAVELARGEFDGRALIDEVAGSAVARRPEGELLVRALVEPAHRVERVWAVEEVTGVERGELIAATFGPDELRDAHLFSLTLTLIVTGRPGRFASEVGAALDTALRSAARGYAVSHGGLYRAGPDGEPQFAEANISVFIRDDRDDGLRIVDAVLHSHGVADAEAKIIDAAGPG